MATLPRLRPEKFYDLVVEVALIRPGPIQGGSVHPYLRRRNGEEEVTYPHPVLEDCLRKTMGVPLFQSSSCRWRSTRRASLRVRRTSSARRWLQAVEGAHGPHARSAHGGMAERGITGATAEGIAKKLEAFASFGFPRATP